jgi:hypothetical protein
VLGYDILARPSRGLDADETEELAPVDIRAGEEDYADMWQDFLLAKAEQSAA